MLLFQTVPCRAQRENNVWYFGRNAGLDFNYTPPRPLNDGAMNTDEGCASVADRATGQLLFYTDGVTVWNRRHTVMPNGTGLLGHSSSTQSALIIPVPGDTAKYYIFTTGNEGYYPPNTGLNYSIVDMQLDGGLGAVTIKNVNLLPESSEKLVGIRKCNERDYWVIGHSLRGNTFYAYSVTPDGVQAPVISNAGILEQSDTATHTFSTGYLKASPDRSKLAAVCDFKHLIEVFDFNLQHGGVRLWQTLHTATKNYGVCFSPDSRLLYASFVYSVTQYRLQLLPEDSGTLAATPIFASQLIGLEENWANALQLGPDGRIYIAASSHFVSVIEKPDSPGVACNFHDSAIWFHNAMSLVGLPNNIDSRYDQSSCGPPIAEMGVTDSLICQSECLDFKDSSASDPVRWHWEFDGGIPPFADVADPGPVCFSSSGLHRVTLIAGNSGGRDTTIREVTVQPAVDTSSIVRLIVDDVAGAPGDTTHIHLSIAGSQASKDQYSELHYRISVDSTLVVPADSSHGFIDSSGTHFDRTVLIDPHRDTAFDFSCTIGSGNDGHLTNGQITLEDVHWLQSCVGLTSVDNGTLTINGVTKRDGQEYLDGRSLYVGEYPNPTSGNLSMILVPVETGHTSVSLYDLVGRRVRILYDGSITLGRYHFYTNLGSLASGTYLCRVTTPSRVVVTRVVLLR